MTGIAEAVQTTTELRKPLTALVNKGCVPVGGIFRLDYDSAVVLTDDFKKHEAGDVPRGGFLLAVAGETPTRGSCSRTRKSSCSAAAGPRRSPTNRS